MTANADSLAELALSHGRAGRTAEALRFAEEAIALAPNHGAALLLAGILNAQTGQYARAVVQLETVLAEDPQNIHALYWMSSAHQKLGHLEDATRYARRAVETSPREPLAHERLAYCYLATFEHEAAEACFRFCVNAQPSNAAFIGGLGLALKGQGKVHEARSLFERASRLNPRSATSFLYLATLLTEEQEFEGAMHAAEMASKLKPESDEAFLAVISTQLEAGEAGRALEALDNRIATGQHTGKVYTPLGQVKQSLGDTKGAIEAFQHALELDAFDAAAWLGMVRARRMEQDDQAIMTGMAEALESNRLDDAAQRDIHYALGKACDDIGRFEEAMSHFDEANRISRLFKYGKTPYDSNVTRSRDEFAMAMFTRELLAAHKGVGSASTLPIFVVGMMRSGTTLTEQILASHHEIGGAGELQFWTKNVNRAFARNRPEFKPAMLKPLGDEYCALVQARAPGNQFVVDKMPANYQVLQLIHLALPKARIIHVCRHPVDTCLSIWSTPNSARVDWAHDKENTVFAYRQYQALMSTWRQALPDGAMLEIQYEELVANPEATSRRMIEFLGLDWDENCLRPHERRGSVLTPSSWQVRQPVYTSSVGRWSRYEPWLGAFGRLLD